MLNILKGSAFTAKLVYKLNQICVLGVRYKKTSPKPNKPSSLIPLPPGRRIPPSQCSHPFPQPILPPACKTLSVPGPKQEQDCSKTYLATIDDLPVPCGWFTGRDLLLTSVYNRYLWMGLILMTLSIYEFKRNEMVKRYNTNYQYINNFDYDLDYKNLSTELEAPD